MKGKMKYQSGGETKGGMVSPRKQHAMGRSYTGYANEAKPAAKPKFKDGGKADLGYQKYGLGMRKAPRGK